jgi:hypothetical protein
MGVDDAVKLHERVGSMFNYYVEPDDGPGAGPLGQLMAAFPTYTWQLVFGPVMVALGVFLLWFLNRELPSVKMKSLVVLAIGLFATAVVIDFVEGMDTELPDRIGEFFGTDGGRIVHFSKSVEEFMEMAATTT